MFAIFKHNRFIENIKANRAKVFLIDLLINIILIHKPSLKIFYNLKLFVEINNFNWLFISDIKLNFYPYY